MASRYETSGPAETEAVGAEVARTLSRGDVVLVEGELGAGKTTFVRGAAQALGVTVPVTSPTFTIGQRYPGPCPVAHLDLYRLDGLGQEEPDLLSDYLGEDTITFAEWPASGAAELAGLGRIAYTVRIDHGGADRRVITVDVVGAERGLGDSDR